MAMRQSAERPRVATRGRRVGPPDRRVERLFTDLENRLAAQYVAMVARAKARLGETSTHTDAMSIIAVEADKYAATMVAAFIAVGKAEAAQLSRQLGRQIVFDPAHAPTRQVAETARRRFLQGFRQEQSASISAAIVRASRISPSGHMLITKARKKQPGGPARDALGLTPYQEKIVHNYKQSLIAGSADALSRRWRDRRFDPTVQNAQDENTPLTWPQINRMTDRYRQRWVVHRAKTVARTQSLMLVNSARHAALHQAAEQANFDPDDIIRTWNAVMDDRTRDSHAALDGFDVQGMDEPFPADGGDLLYPGDPNGPPEEIINCRCWLTYDLPDGRPLDDADDEA